MYCVSHNEPQPSWEQSRSLPERIEACFAVQDDRSQGYLLLKKTLIFERAAINGSSVVLEESGALRR